MRVFVLKILVASLLFLNQDNVFSAQNVDSILESDLWNISNDEIDSIENDLARYIQKYPNSPHAHFLYSHFLLRKFTIDPSNPRLLAKAVALAEQSLQLDSNSEYGYLALINIDFLLGKNSDVVSSLSLAKNKFPYSWRLSFLELQINIDELSFPQIDETLLKIVQTKDSIEQIILPYYVSIIATQLSNNDQIVTKLKQLYQVKSNPVIALEIANAMFSSENYKESKLWYKKISDTIYAPEALSNLADIYIQRENNYVEANKVLEKLSSHELNYRNKYSYFLNKGLIAYKNGNKNAAHKNFVESLRFTHDLSTSLNKISSLLEHDNEYEKLLLAITFEIPGNSWVHFYLAEYLYFEKKDSPDALKYYKNSLLLDPAFAPSYNAIGMILYDLKEFEKAQQYFSEAVEINPDEAVYVYNLACIQALIGDQEKALESLKSAIELNPTYISNAKSDPDFNKMRNSKKFNQLLNSPPEQSENFAH